jgi:hypothetical protein
VCLAGARCAHSMTRFVPGLVRNRETGHEEPGLIETFVPTLPGGRCKWTPRLRPLHLLATKAERATVLAWLESFRPDLLPRSRHLG